jgi:hypothetical protein
VQDCAPEKQARIILGPAPVEIANLFQEASKSYHPSAASAGDERPT